MLSLALFSGSPVGSGYFDSVHSTYSALAIYTHISHIDTNIVSSFIFYSTYLVQSDISTDLSVHRVGARTNSSSPSDY
jgi:hypothetical protein